MSGHEATINRAMSHHRAGEFDKAVTLYRHVLQRDPDNTRALEYLALALEVTRQFDQALESRRRLVRIQPGNAAFRKSLSTLYLAVGDPDASVEVWKELVAFTKSNPAAELGLAKQYVHARREPEALKLLEDITGRRPDDREALYALAALKERVGQEEEAKSLLFRALGNDISRSVEASVMLARLELRAGRPEEACRLLETLASTPHGSGVPNVHAELGLALDKLKRYDEAFQSATRGQKLALEALQPHERDTTAHDRLASDALKITREQVAAWARAPTGAPLPAGAPAVPVFVVGFPRSGTTLVEQMLAAHPGLAVSDELPTLAGVRHRLYAQHRPGGAYPTNLHAFTPEQIADGRRWYLERAYRTVPHARPDAAGARARRIVDKNPGNTLYVCLVRLLFPESPVIYVQRDPRDSVLSVFLQGFTRAVPHLHTLNGAARLFAILAELWRHSEQTLGLRTLRVRYEDLVADPEHEARRMIDFIGEPWDPAVLNYHAAEHRRFVNTPSYADVSKPVYKRAVGRWKNYETHLAPVLDVLQPWVQEGGYT